jgi:8-oxo-dGTP diphosphatase
VTINLIRGGGCVVWRRTEEDQIEIALVHRPKYGDWSFPKGKCEENETPLAAAYRETLEETGFQVEISRLLGDVEYEVEGVKKSVTYWRAKFVANLGSKPDFEVDQVRWFAPERAVENLKNESDREILKKFLDTDLDTKIIILLRHCKAVARTAWVEEDLKRPLDEVGIEQALKLVENLVPFRIEEIHSSIAVRCYESINPIAQLLSLNYFFTDSLSEEVYNEKPNRVFKYIDRLLESTGTILVCSHNPILPHYLQNKLNRQGFNVSDTFLKPGDAWVVHHIQKEIISVDKIHAPTIA